MQMLNDFLSMWLKSMQRTATMVILLSNKLNSDWLTADFCSQNDEELLSNTMQWIENTKALIIIIIYIF